MSVESHIYCIRCGYDLFGLTEYRCPECSTTFSPGNPATYSLASNPRPLWTLIVSKVITLWIGTLLGLILPSMFGQVSAEPPVGRIGSVFLVVAGCALLLHRYRIRGTVDMLLIALAAQAWLLFFWAQLSFLGGRLYRLGDVLVFSFCTTIAWLAGLAISLILSAAGSHSQDGE